MTIELRWVKKEINPNAHDAALVPFITKINGHYQISYATGLSLEYRDASNPFSSGAWATVPIQEDVK